jgi:hypothetical protein
MYVVESIFPKTEIRNANVKLPGKVSQILNIQIKILDISSLLL